MGQLEVGEGAVRLGRRGGGRGRKVVTLMVYKQEPVAQDMISIAGD